MTIGHLLSLLLVIAWAWLISGWVITWSRRRRSRPSAVEALRSQVQARREAWRRAAATEYGNHTRKGREP